MDRLALLDRGFPGRPCFDTAFSRALLLRTAQGAAGETLRLYRPDDVLAFSVLDRTRPGFEGAVAAARGAGFAPVLRLAGGRAAVFHRETLAFAWSRPLADLRAGLQERFREAAALLCEALAGLGVEARVGAVPGEYCPGDHSVNARGRTKLAGVGQRVVRGAAYVGGVIVVRDSARVREALVPVYRALGYDLDPAAAGSVEDEIGGVTVEDVAAAVVRALGERFAVSPAEPDPETLALASRLEPGQRVDSLPDTRDGAGADPKQVVEAGA